MMARASQRSNGTSDGWFTQQIGRQRAEKSYRNHVAVDEVMVHWVDLCAREDLRKSFKHTGLEGIRTLLHHYSWSLYRR